MAAGKLPDSGASVSQGVLAGLVVITYAAVLDPAFTANDLAVGSALPDCQLNANVVGTGTTTRGGVAWANSVPPDQVNSASNHGFRVLTLVLSAYCPPLRTAK